ncbi:MAG: hypothetical protein L7F78_16045 [Syntrophales bacterium LBB04]|nr:hypothetical protein [Syntrophales bacterium LBB04]
MENVKRNRANKGAAKKSATMGKTKVDETFACGCCRPIVTVDECGCVETRTFC